jgi:hypothetical protein
VYYGVKTTKTHIIPRFPQPFFPPPLDDGSKGELKLSQVSN